MQQIVIRVSHGGKSFNRAKDFLSLKQNLYYFQEIYKWGSQLWEHLRNDANFSRTYNNVTYCTILYYDIYHFINFSWDLQPGRLKKNFISFSASSVCFQWRFALVLRRSKSSVDLNIWHCDWIFRKMSSKAKRLDDAFRQGLNLKNLKKEL